MLTITEETIKNKPLLKSKTFWVNIIALLVLVAQGQFGVVITAETQVVLLGLINLLLRAYTKENLTWT